MNRKSIPKSLKNKVWDYYIGQAKGLAPCYCCGQNMDSKNFECGHVLAVKRGGKNELSNMRPICSCCNKSMGTQDLEEFRKEYFCSPLSDIKNYLTKFEKFIKIIDNITR